MAGLIFVSPGKFTDPADLPQVPTAPVVPVRGATIDWAADRLPTGPLATWTDMLGTKTLAAPANTNQYPAVVGDGAARRVVFDGTNDRMGVTISMSQPVTLAVVARAVSTTPGGILFTGFDTQTWNLGINDPGGRWIFTTGAGSSIMSPTDVLADTGWHVFVICVDGAGSTLTVDGVETTAPINPVTWQTMSIGSSASAYSPVELRRFAVVPRATSPAERASITQRLRTHYGI